MLETFKGELKLLISFLQKTKRKKKHIQRDQIDQCDFFKKHQSGLTYDHILLAASKGSNGLIKIFGTLFLQKLQQRPLVFSPAGKSNAALKFRLTL